MDKASRFGDQHMKVVNQDPMLNENNRIPYASSGSQAITSAQYTAQEAAVKELSKIGGLIAFVDSKCRFCAMQLPVLEMMRANHGLETLVVSIDGKRPGNYKGPLVTDNGLYKKLDLMLTPSVVFVPKPKAYAESDPNTYLIISQGFYAADQMTKMIAYAGHDKQLLSANTMKELDVWQRGIASTQDLQNLELDINDPKSFKEKLRPILAKQYER
jgi:conjugal transfer pilus assembly protein TraF